MHDAHIAEETLLALPATAATPLDVAYGAVTGTSHSSSGQRVVQITAANGYNPDDYDRVCAALRAHDTRADWDVDWAPDGATIWRITYEEGM